ncbi:MAG: alpha/beta fold hydrolase, partial [Actinocrinis sp.]
GSRLELFPDTGHFPFHTEPQRFLHILRDFIESSEPASFAPEQWRQMLRNRKPEMRPKGSGPSAGESGGARISTLPRRAA